MNRIAYMVLRNILNAPRWFWGVWKLGRQSDKHTDKERYDYLRNIVIKINKSGRVNIKSSGVDNIPTEEGFILFPNHQGLFDMLALIETCPHPLRVVIKKEVANVILVKQVIELLRGSFMDRQDIRSSMEIIHRMSEEVKSGKNYVIFAEGTRSREGNQILNFKAGTFKSAVNAKCPIVPVALINSFQPFDVSSIKEVNVQVHYLEPISYNQYMGMKTMEIADVVHNRIQEKINENM
ncbi:MAG: lysophospholipid acyltransferase family protein [Clostridium sp.]